MRFGGLWKLFWEGSPLVISRMLSVLLYLQYVQVSLLKDVELTRGRMYRWWSQGYWDGGRMCSVVLGVGCGAGYARLCTQGC